MIKDKFYLLYIFHILYKLIGRMDSFHFQTFTLRLHLIQGIVFNVYLPL